MSDLEHLLEFEDLVRVVDIGANPDNFETHGKPPYHKLLERQLVHVTGFEPQRDALAALLAKKGANETYLPYVVGDGKPATLNICFSKDMTSVLKPNEPVQRLFYGMPDWGHVVATEEVETRRLDDIEELGEIDYLKMDIQGCELAALKGGVESLKETVVIQLEWSFVPLYKGEPLFGDIDVFLRSQGFVFHTFSEIHKRTFAPLIVGGSVHKPLNQYLQADAVYVRDFTRFNVLSSRQLKSLALTLHYCYSSYDLAMLAIRAHDDKFGSAYWEGYFGLLGVEPPPPDWSTSKLI